MNSSVPTFTLKEFSNAIIRATEETDVDPGLPIEVLDEEAVVQEIAALARDAQLDAEMPVTDLVAEMESVELGVEFDVER